MSRINDVQFAATATDPSVVLEDVAPDSLPADAPPAEANYRPAELAGLACAFCQKFRYKNSITDEGGNIIPVGVCELYEAKVQGDHISNGYAEGGPTYDKNGDAQWDSLEYSDLDDTPLQYAEVHFAGGVAPVKETEGKLTKGILRTGHWDITPTPVGKIKKPLTIVRDGKGDPRKGVISMSEIVDNFKAKRGVKKVLVPFAQKKQDDHIKDGNLARVNTGFVDNIWIEDEGDVSHLMGEFRLTDGTVKKMVLEGSLDDVSSGIPYHPEHGYFLEHVAHTPYPFIDGQRSWLAASDAPQVIQDAEITVFSLVQSEDVKPANEEADETPASLSFRQVIDGTLAALSDQLGADSEDYAVDDATAESVTITNSEHNKTWTVPYTVEDSKIVLAEYSAWEEVENVENSPPSNEDEDLDSDSRNEDEKSPLEVAGELREMRIAASSQLPKVPTTGGDIMTVVPTPEELAKLELSDEAKEAFQNLINENVSLSATNREAEVDARIEEISGFGFSDRPGFLKLYRTVALSDDGLPAAVLLSDDGSTEETISAKEILDRAIDALKGTEGTISFSDQHLESGNDKKPPVDGGESRSVEERVADAKSFLGKK